MPFDNSDRISCPVDNRHHTADVGKVKVSPFKMGLTNTVVLQEKGLEDDVLVLPIRGAFLWIARVKTVSAAIHVVQTVLGVLSY